MQGRRWIAIFTITLAQAAAAQSTPPSGAASAAAGLPAIETFFAYPDLAQPRLSPSGRWLAVLVANHQTQRNILALVDVGAPGSPKALASFSDADIAEVHWVGDDYLVFDVVDLQLGSGENRLAPGLFSIQREGGGLRELVKLRGNPFISGSDSATNRRLDYNHVLLDVPRDGSQEVIVGEIEFDPSGHIRSLLPRRLNVASGRTRRIVGVEGAPAKVGRWLFDLAGEPRVAIAQHEGRHRVHWRAPGQDGWALLGDFDSLAALWSPHSVDASGSLFVTVASGADGTQVLSRFDFATGKPQPEPMVSVPGFDFHGYLVNEGTGDRVLGVRSLSDGEITVWFDEGIKAMQAEIDGRLPGRINRLSCRRCGAEDAVVLVESMSDHDPGSYLLWHVRTKSFELLGRRHKAIDPRRMASVDFQRIQARDGRSLPLWLTLPAPGTADAARPAVVLVHGGPWVRGGSWGWHALPQFLASRGYVVIEPEFRGSTGFGAAHFRAGWRQWGQAMQDDVADAVLWAAGKSLIDPKRVCIAGGSYGGYATLMGLVRHPELYRCGAAWVAVTEPMRLLERSWWTADDISDEARQYSLPTLIGDAKADAAMLAAASPVQQAARIVAPVMLVYGEHDRRVPLVHGKDMRAALTDAGRAPEWVVYPDEGHGWRKLETQRDFARRLEVFLARHLR